MLYLQATGKVQVESSESHIKLSWSWEWVTPSVLEGGENATVSPFYWNENPLVPFEATLLGEYNLIKLKNRFVFSLGIGL